MSQQEKLRKLAVRRMVVKVGAQPGVRRVIIHTPLIQIHLMNLRKENRMRLRRILLSENRLVMAHWLMQIVQDKQLTRARGAI